MIYTLYTDGSCPKPNGPGGWASICLEREDFTVAGYSLETTNNRMELDAVISGLNTLPEGSVVTVYVDSQYVVFGITRYIDTWIANGRLERGSIKNPDLWRQLLAAVERHKSVAWIHVKGHAGNEWNEKADILAGEQTVRARQILEEAGE